MHLYVYLNKTYLRATHASFVTKEFRKANIQRINIYLKQRTGKTKVAYKQQRDECVIMLKKSKRSCFENF